MIPTVIIATLGLRGARLHLLDGDSLAVTPKGALDDDLRAAIHEQKRALVAMLNG